MTIERIAAILALVAVVIGVGVSYGKLEGRLSSIERVIDAPRQVMREEGKEIITEAKEVHDKILRESGNLVSVVSLGDKSCVWVPSETSSEKAKSCPDGFYAKGIELQIISLSQVNSRLFCCGLR